MKIRIVALPRSGSSYLRSMLDFQMFELEDYFSISEPFNESKIHKLTKQEILYCIKNKKNVLVKNMVFETETYDLEYLFDYTICLTRRNLFEATLSRVIALKTNVWDEKHDSNLNLKIDFFEFRHFLNETISWNENLLKIKSNKLIYYEDLVFKSDTDLKLFDNLLVHKHFYQTTRLYSKQQIVLNYLDLKEEFGNY